MACMELITVMDLTSRTNLLKLKSRTQLKFAKVVITKCLRENNIYVCMHSEKRAIDILASQNISELVEKLPEKHQMQIAHSVLKRKSDALDSPTCRSIDLKLNTKGAHKTIIFESRNTKKDVSFSAESLDNFQNNTGSSSRHMRKLTNFIRCNAGKRSVPSNYREHASEKSKILEDLYQCGEFDFDTTKGGPKQKRPVVWADANDLLGTILKKRNFVGKYQIKVMADGDQGSFKIFIL